MFVLTFMLMLVVLVPSGLVIMQRLDELSQENKSLKAQIVGLETDIGGLETTIGGLETNIRGLETNIRGLEFDIGGSETNIRGLKTTNEQLQAAVDSLSLQLQAVSASTAAYFSVAANSTERYTGYTGPAIKFPVTFANVIPAGTTGGWDPAINRFICPVTGDYMFVVTLFKEDSFTNSTFDEFSAVLTHTPLFGADRHITRLSNKKDSRITEDIHFSSTMQAIVPCREGDRVWVKPWCGRCNIFDNSWKRNTFSGFKL